MYFSDIINSLENSKAGLIEYSKIGKNPNLDSGASLEKAKPNQITFLEQGNKLKDNFESTLAGAILLPNKQELKSIAINLDCSWAILENPRLAFAEVLDLLNPKRIYPFEVHETSVIGKNVDIKKGVYIGPHVCIGDNSKIGKNTIIHAGVIIYEKVLIGEKSELHSNCVIHPESQIGNECIIHSNAVIGSEGFGFVPTPTGWRKMPQTGYVLIEDKVEIGSNSTIDRPAVGKTHIGEGTKIDNLVQIGHGVKTGKNCAMASQVGIAGGAQIGNGVIFAGQVGVGNRVKVGDQVIASSKCGIHSDIEPKQVISGFPAISNRLWLKCSANFKRLPEFAKALRDLSKELDR